MIKNLTKKKFATKEEEIEVRATTQRTLQDLA